MKTLIIALALTVAVHAQQATCLVEGYVSRIIDGDTFVMKARIVHECEHLALFDDSDSLITIRIVALDAPESNQPFGQEAKDALERLLPVGTPCLARKCKTGKYVGRIVAEVFSEQHWGDPYNVDLDSLKTYIVNDSLISVQMINTGYAWAYMCKEKSREREVERYAKEFERGLWASENPIPPWEWRKQRRSR